MNNEEIFSLAQNLSENIKNCDSYKNYLIVKRKISLNPELSKKINEFKSIHLDFQTKLLQNISPTFQEEINVSKLYSDLILNDDARFFLESEGATLKIITEIQNIIGDFCKIDMDF